MRVAGQNVLSSLSPTDARAARSWIIHLVLQTDLCSIERAASKSLPPFLDRSRAAFPISRPAVSSRGREKKRCLIPERVREGSKHKCLRWRARCPRRVRVAVLEGLDDAAVETKKGRPPLAALNSKGGLEYSLSRIKALRISVIALSAKEKCACLEKAPLALVSGERGSSRVSKNRSRRHAEFLRRLRAIEALGFKRMVRETAKQGSAKVMKEGLHLFSPKSLGARARARARARPSV